MIESSLAFSSSAPEKNNATYNLWQQSMASTSRRHAAMRYDMNERTAGPIPAFGRLLRDHASAALSHENGANALSGQALSPASRPDIGYESTTPEDDYSFGDVIDMINPLHHLPVVGTLYRKFSGDSIKSFASIIGGAIFGGPVGAVSGTVNAIVKDRTGKDIGDNLLSMANIGKDAPPTSRDLVYLPPENRMLELAGTTIAMADLKNAPYGKQNFARSVPANNSYNS